MSAPEPVHIVDEDVNFFQSVIRDIIEKQLFSAQQLGGVVPEYPVVPSFLL